jgi:SAM-dependent MidA family methyltransferase
MEPRFEIRREPGPDLQSVGQDEALAERIRREIASTGPITFARFMELALYDEDGGYYRGAEARPGRGGDFLTAPEAHPIFGGAVSLLLEDAWDRLGRPARFVVREYGTGTGALAEGVLRGLTARGSALATAIRYQPVEIDPRRVEMFEQRLTAAGFGPVIEPPDERPIVGSILVNEVLDALPVHRVGVRDGEFRERFVDVVEGAFVDAWLPPSTPALAVRLAAEGVALVEGQSAEICLAVDGWIADAAAGLERGLLVLIDYGAPAAALYDPVRRRDGTLRAYVRHRVHDDPYRHVGRQDLTAHVDVTAVERAAHRAGLSTVGITTQAEFLVGVGTERLLRAIQADPATTMADYLEVRSALMRLLDPSAMGRFRVMAFGRDWPDGPPLAGFDYRLR